MSDQVEALSEMLTPFGDDIGDVVDWEAVKSAYGTDFPEDYKAFVRLFGNGTVEGMIGVRIPIVTVDPMVRRVAPLSSSIRTDPAFNRWADPNMDYTLDQLLVWGETDSADVLCWIAVGSNPDGWPVAVYVRGDAAWTVYRCGMAEFLVKLLRGEFSECPITDASLMGLQNPRFLHDREEERLAEQGVYPWD
ncbi:SMI1/KNR4 family protein [Streptomyces lavendofoliae]|uniref:Knr4/Smi1-like domain-containing protein n=1 Tax=Streptomyces lavendofoliae TaxID=67314 RepID=A0A918I3E3_9ACTN|nr:SMI1/KNR4 family protein [Streptomyces lavendofoliae]GGU66273.1 hypothetical protein GCM10010274_63610 [Streptomyces lavendofoliae]